MNFSYKRYWEPSTAQVLGSSIAIGAIAQTITYPLEFVKTRIQVRAEGVGIRNKNLQQGYSPHRVFRQIHATGQGFSYFFTGIDSFLAARLSYIAIRGVIYKTLYDLNKPYKATNDLSTREKAVIATVAGGTAALVTTPLELINTRVIADGNILKANRRNYTSIGEAWGRISNEGGKGLFRGGLANVIRAVVLNVSLTHPYDYMSERCYSTFGEMPQVNYFFALLWASMWGTAAVTPFENIKTRMMIQFPEAAKNRVGYANYTDCVAKLFQNEGIFSMWVGTQANFYKVFAYSFLTLTLTDELRNKWKQDAGLEKWQM